MKNLTAKQEARLEKKKRKTAALTNLISLNDRDGRKNVRSSATGSSEESGSDVIGSQEVDQSDAPISSENLRKRLKRKIDKEVPAVVSPSLATDTLQPSTSSTETPAPISTLDYMAMKKMLHARKRSHAPKIRLKLFGELAQLSNHPCDRTPIFITDVHNLVMNAVLGSTSPCTPFRWCNVERTSKVSHVVVLVIEGVSLYDYTANQSIFSESTKCLNHSLEVVLPADGHIIQEFVRIPVTDSQSEELIMKYGSLEAAMESTQNQTLLVQSVFPVQTSEPVQQKIAHATPDEVVPRTQLLLSALQLVDEGYPIPLRGDLAARYKSFVFTKDNYLPVTESSPMFGLDCEMCRTSAGINELTRISIINESFGSVYETLVRPDNKIVDYLTQYSGITGAMMLNVTKTRSDVQKDIRELLPGDAILVGQSLQCDLVAMQMMHPYVIDTSCIYNVNSERRFKSKLQTLSLMFLNEVIQDNPLGHDSIEDCASSLKLAKLKMSKGVEFGDAILAGRRKANEVQRQENNGENKPAVPEPPKKKLKSTTIIASTETGVDYESFVNSFDGLAKLKNKHIVCVSADSNKGAVRKTQELAIQHDLTLSHIKVGGVVEMAEENVAKTLSRVDRWIAKCWESVAANGMFVVIMGGGQSRRVTDDELIVANNHSGVVLFDIKASNSSNVLSNTTK